MSSENGIDKTMSRRRMLSLLGLTAGAAYAAPVLLQLGEARASSFSRPSGGRRRRRRRTRNGTVRRSFSR